MFYYSELIATTEYCLKTGNLEKLVAILNTMVVFGRRIPEPQDLSALAQYESAARLPGADPRLGPLVMKLAYAYGTRAHPPPAQT